MLEKYLTEISTSAYNLILNRPQNNLPKYEPQRETTIRAFAYCKAHKMPNFMV